MTESHIEIDDRGLARIAGSRIKVSQIARDLRAGQSEHDIQAAYPHLSLDQIRAARAYVVAHQSAIDAQIDAEDAFVERMRQAADSCPVRAKLEHRGLST